MITRMTWNALAGLMAIGAAILAAGDAVEPVCVRTSVYTEKREAVPPPATALRLVGYPGHDATGAFDWWDRSNSYHAGRRPAGSYVFSCSLVTEDGKLSRPGPATPALVAKTDEWQCVVRTPGIDHWTRAVGTVMWFRRADAAPDSPWYPLGGMPNLQIQNDVDLPALPLAGWMYHDLRGHCPLVALFDHSGGGIWKWDDSVAPPPAPIVRLHEVPNITIDVAYAWACNYGETALSPVTRINVIDYAIAPPTLNTFSEVSRELIPPQGALGMYVYLRTPDGPWHRQKAPHGDSYLWPLWANRLDIENYEETGIAPGDGPGESDLSPLNLALRDSEANVLVDSKFRQRCPVINPYKVLQGNKMGRSISAEGAAYWDIEDDPEAPGPGGWPVWLENASRTRLIGTRIRLNRSCAGIAFMDYHGGGAFHFQGQAIHIENGINWWLLPWYTAGFIQTWSGRGVANDHAASEVVLMECGAAVRFPIVCEPNQSVNWLATNFGAFSSGGSETAIVTLGNSGAIRFYERFAVDNARTVFAVTSANELYCEAWFLDQGFPCWLTVAGLTSPTLRVTGGKANTWQPWQHIVEVPSCPQRPEHIAATVRISAMQRQSNTAVEDVAYCKPAAAVRVNPPEDNPIQSVIRKPGETTPPPAFMRRKFQSR